MDEFFLKNKRVFLTGHTGVKGAWLCRILAHMGAEVTGYALPPEQQENLFDISGAGEFVHSVLGDINDFDLLYAAFEGARPEIVIHMAAQPLVQRSYKQPLETYQTNVMGTVHLLECARLLGGVRSLLNVTTDKVYQNNEQVWGYRENEPLDGYDPYSNSKSCSELVTHSYQKSFLAQQGTAVSTARAGNILCGGDFSENRILPDCFAAARGNVPIQVRNPFSVRPYQHVLEALGAYLLIVQKQYENRGLAGYYNVGPRDEDCVDTGSLVSLFCACWGEGQTWQSKQVQAPHEAGLLRLDCSYIRHTLGWRPVWNINGAVEKTVEWYKAYHQGQDVAAVMDRQIADFIDQSRKTYV